LIQNIIHAGIRGSDEIYYENYSPGCIVKNIKRASTDPTLEKIACKAKIMIEREFTFESKIWQWKRILDNS